MVEIVEHGCKKVDLINKKYESSRSVLLLEGEKSDSFNPFMDSRN